MDVITIEKNTYEMMRDHFNKFINEIKQLCETSQHKKWLDNQDVCLLLQISKRTLQ